MFVSKMFAKLSMLGLGLSLATGCEPRDGTELEKREPDPAASTAPSSGTATSSTSTSSTPAAPDTAASVKEAHARLVAIGNSGVSGEIHFAQKNGKVSVTGKVTGLKPGEHGFHVHEKGDLSDTEKGLSAGDHFNPEHLDHGRPTDTKRHAGDFGNITAEEDGVTDIAFDDSVVKLDGPNSIVGRSIVIHAEADRFTQPAGDAGARVAFGKIELANP